MEPQAMIRQLRDANRDDKDLVRLCNETVLIFRNLKKEEAWGSAQSREAIKNMREKLRYNMEWLANWKRKRFVVVTSQPL